MLDCRRRVAFANEVGKQVNHVITEIVILAMIAAFLGLRLYSVLGRRSEHEEEVVPHRFERADTPAQAENAPRPARQPVVLRGGDNAAPASEAGVRAIAAASPGFDLLGFLEGAKGAYAMILEAFWKGDKDTLRELTDGDVYESFAQAIDAREEAGETLDNRLIRIEDATVRSADLDGRIARIAVLFVADIAAVTRSAEGNVLAGSLDDAIESRDVWTFRRNVDAADPNWVLDETDEG
tara:strand:+ start:573 stop:1286 length:714 start_codon:yes stop_codon:yes gene_type:complete